MLEIAVGAVAGYFAGKYQKQILAVYQTIKRDVIQTIKDVNEHK